MQSIPLQFLSCVGHLIDGQQWRWPLTTHPSSKAKTLSPSLSLLLFSPVNQWKIDSSMHFVIERARAKDVQCNRMGCTEDTYGHTLSKLKEKVTRNWGEEKFNSLTLKVDPFTFIRLILNSTDLQDSHLTSDFSTFNFQRFGFPLSYGWLFIQLKVSSFSLLFIKGILREFINFCVQ